MAGDWIKFEHCTLDKPEVVQMSEILGIEQDLVVGKLLRVWVWCDQQSINGDALGVTKSFISRIVSVTGFAEAMVKVGWLNDNQGNLSIPNFTDHNGESAKRRALTQKRMRKLRRGSRDEDVTQETSPEKRREENNSLTLFFPPELDHEDFREAWKDYVVYRKESRIKALQPKSVQTRFKEFVEWGRPAAIKAIRDSISNGYQGIFKPKSNGKDDPQLSLERQMKL